MYFLNYVDRNAIAQARINDIEEDLGMTGNDFNTAVSILFVGYVLMCDSPPAFMSTSNSDL